MERIQLDREIKMWDKAIKDLDKKKEEVLLAKIKELEAREREVRKREIELESKQKFLDFEMKRRRQLDEKRNASFKRTSIVANNSRFTSHIRNDNEELLRSIEAELTCGVCLELLVRPVLLNCGHSFCLHCIKHWKDSNPVVNKCPVCRQRIQHECRQLILDNIIGVVVDERHKKVAKPPQKSIHEDHNQ